MNNNVRFRAFIKLKGLTVKQVSERTGIPSQTLYNYTRSEDSPGYRAMPDMNLRYIMLLLNERSSTVV